MKKKFFAVLVMLSLVVTSIPINALDADTIAEPTADEEVLEYLLDAGYPQEIIDTMSESLKLKFFEQRQTYESSDTTYGIMTEEYHITYQVDSDGEILIDNANLAQLDALMAEQSTVEKILSDKNQAILSEGDTLQSQALKAELSASASAASVQETESASVSAPMLTEEQAQFVDNMQEVEPAVALATLSNWYASIYVNQRAGTNKSLMYIWSWEYRPLATDIDKMAIAWSGGFTFLPSSVYWEYEVNVTKSVYDYSLGTWTPVNVSKYEMLNQSYGYDENLLNCGVSKDVDIIEYYDDAANNCRWYSTEHFGKLYVEISNSSGSSTASGEAIAQYFHHNTVGSPGTLSFTSQPSITMNGGWYDTSSTSTASISFYK